MDRTNAKRQRRPKAPAGGASALKPGTLLRYVSNVHTPPRRKLGEILCHNHVDHLTWTNIGINGFRYFICEAAPDTAGSLACAAGCLISASTTPGPITSASSANASRLVSR